MEQVNNLTNNEKFFFGPLVYFFTNVVYILLFFFALGSAPLTFYLQGGTLNILLVFSCFLLKNFYFQSWFLCKSEIFVGNAVRKETIFFASSNVGLLELTEVSLIGSIIYGASSRSHSHKLLNSICLLP